MPTKIIITPTAFKEIQQSIDYYNKAQKGLGKKFKLAVDNIFNQLKTTPKSGSFIYYNCRYRVVKTFSFIIIYEVKEDNQIFVYRIFNTSKNPFWLQ